MQKDRRSVFLAQLLCEEGAEVPCHCLCKVFHGFSAQGCHQLVDLSNMFWRHWSANPTWQVWTVGLYQYPILWNSSNAFLLGIQHAADPSAHPKVHRPPGIYPDLICAGPLKKQCRQIGAWIDTHNPSKRVMQSWLGTRLQLFSSAPFRCNTVLEDGSTLRKNSARMNFCWG